MSFILHLENFYVTFIWTVVYFKKAKFTNFPCLKARSFLGAFSRGPNRTKKEIVDRASTICRQLNFDYPFTHTWQNRPRVTNKNFINCLVVVGPNRRRISAPEGSRSRGGRRLGPRVTTSARMKSIGVVINGNGRNVAEEKGIRSSNRKQFEKLIKCRWPNE